MKLPLSGCSLSVPIITIAFFLTASVALAARPDSPRELKTSNIAMFAILDTRLAERERERAEQLLP